MDELAGLSADMDPELKRKAFIGVCSSDVYAFVIVYSCRFHLEMKALKLLDLQKRVRADVAMRMRKVAELEASADASFRRTSKKKDSVTGSRYASSLPAGMLNAGCRYFKEFAAPNAFTMHVHLRFVVCVQLFPQPLFRLPRTPRMSLCYLKWIMKL
jgi:hypothetical protein